MTEFYSKKQVTILKMFKAVLHGTVLYSGVKSLDIYVK